MNLPLATGRRAPVFDAKPALVGAFESEELPDDGGITGHRCV